MLFSWEYYSISSKLFLLFIARKLVYYYYFKYYGRIFLIRLIIRQNDETLISLTRNTRFSIQTINTFFDLNKQKCLEKIIKI